MRQVILIDETGAVETIMPKGGIDLREVGRVSVQRVSLIEFDEEKQQYWIECKVPGYEGRPLLTYVKTGEPTMFDTYDEAVAAEIEAFSVTLEGGVSLCLPV